MRAACVLLWATSVLAAQVVWDAQDDGSRTSNGPYGHPLSLPRIESAKYEGSSVPVPPPEHMTLYPLHSSGQSNQTIDLTFFSDGYTTEEEDKFVRDAEKLTEDIVSSNGAMYDVAHLLNVWAVFVPSEHSGIGTHDAPLPGAAFGLYRPGAELRGVYVTHHKRARAACAYWRGADHGGCDQPILLGNDPLYGGLGGEFTVITASKLNGPVVLRHELGHSLINVGEEYEGGEVYSGVNADKVEHLHNLKWSSFLSDPDNVRIEDARVAVQHYPWYNLTESAYTTTFFSSNLPKQVLYPSSMLRFSLSSIPYPSHIRFLLNGQVIDLSKAFLPEWEGSSDRRWLQLALTEPLPAGENRLVVELTQKGLDAEEGQGGKMLTSVEIMEYGGDGRFNADSGHIGAYPTYSISGKMTLRPTNEECLMRDVMSPKFCPVCAHGLKDALETMIAGKQRNSVERA